MILKSETTTDLSAVSLPALCHEGIRRVSLQSPIKGKYDPQSQLLHHLREAERLAMEYVQMHGA